jgi:hypothetical protein
LDINLKSDSSRIPKKLVFWGFFFALLILVTASPLVSIFLFTEGFIHKNPSRISSFVNYPALRHNLKQQFSSYEERRSRTDRSSLGFLFHPIRGAITPAVIDRFVNPSLPRRILGPSRPSSKTNEDSPSKPSPVRYAGYSLHGWNSVTIKLRLEVTDPHMRGQVLGLVFTRHSFLKWVLTNISLPDPLIQAVLKKAQS